jgi:hypothetical protein
MKWKRNEAWKGIGNIIKTELREIYYKNTNKNTNWFKSLEIVIYLNNI